MLCHGTSGNGLAFLRLFRRTGDELWLKRARRFAMHALAQVAASPPRYSLWTGGVGVALYLVRCLDGEATVPVIDVL
jgi:Lanthionine synthetase C-like protein